MPPVKFNLSKTTKPNKCLPPAMIFKLFRTINSEEEVPHDKNQPFQNHKQGRKCPRTVKFNHDRTIIFAEDTPMLKFSHFRTKISKITTRRCPPCKKFKHFKTTISTEDTHVKM